MCINYVFGQIGVLIESSRRKGINVLCEVLGFYIRLTKFPRLIWFLVTSHWPLIIFLQYLVAQFIPKSYFQGPFLVILYRMDKSKKHIQSQAIVNYVSNTMAGSCANKSLDQEVQRNIIYRQLIHWSTKNFNLVRGVTWWIES